MTLPEHNPTRIALIALYSEGPDTKSRLCFRLPLAFPSVPRFLPLRLSLSIAELPKTGIFQHCEIKNPQL